MRNYNIIERVILISSKAEYMDQFSINIAGLIEWCRRRDSNSHSVARTGF
jgi:hypothetical protein